MMIFGLHPVDPKNPRTQYAQEIVNMIHFEHAKAVTFPIPEPAGPSEGETAEQFTARVEEHKKNPTIVVSEVRFASGAVVHFREPLETIQNTLQQLLNPRPAPQIMQAMPLPAGARR